MFTIGIPAYPLPVVMCRVGPPVCLHLDVAQDHVLDGRRQPRHLPGDVGLPAAEGFGQVLKDGPGFVLLDSCEYDVRPELNCYRSYNIG